LDFGDFGAEPIEPLDDGDINMLVVPENLPVTRKLTRKLTRRIEGHDPAGFY
jgi:hypothetical protein